MKKIKNPTQNIPGNICFWSFIIIIIIVNKNKILYDFIFYQVGDLVTFDSRSTPKPDQFWRLLWWRYFNHIHLLAPTKCGKLYVFVVFPKPPPDPHGPLRIIFLRGHCTDSDQTSQEYCLGHCAVRKGRWLTSRKYFLLFLIKNIQKFSFFHKNSHNFATVVKKVEGDGSKCS